MARTSTITFATVAKIADTMKAAGIRPTSRGIRERIGSGSMGTIHNLLKQWQGKAPGEDEEGETIDIPAHVQKAIADFVQTETAQALEAQSEEMEATREGADDLARENERITEALEEAENIANEMKSQNATAQAMLEAARAELEAAKDELASAQSQLATEKQNAAVALAQNEGLKERIEEYKTTIEQQRQQMQQLATLSTRSERENATLQNALTTAQETLQSCQAPKKKPASSKKPPVSSTDKTQQANLPTLAPTSQAKAKTSANKEKPL